MIGASLAAFGNIAKLPRAGILSKMLNEACNGWTTAKPLELSLDAIEVLGRAMTPVVKDMSLSSKEAATAFA